MGKCKEHINKHLVSAKTWVSRAEQSFEKEKDIRGELDLFLAHAEIAHAQKASRLRRLVQYPLFKQGAALIVALFAVAFGLGASYWLNVNLPAQPSEITSPGKNMPSNYPITSSNGALLNQEQNFPGRTDSMPAQGGQAFKLSDNTAGQPPALTKENTDTPAATANAKIAQQAARPYSPAPVSVSKEQMQTLIRSAGDSLRSRE